VASLAELTVSIVGDVSNVRKAFDELGKGVDNVGTSLTKMGNDMKSMGTSMSLYVTAPLVAMGAGMSSMAMNFESEMLKVKAVTDATDEDIAKLSQTALQLGADTVFGATDAAEAMVYFGQAGYDVDQIMAATGDTLYLAAAAELELGHAADIVTDILAGYNLGADAAGHVTDVLAQTAADTKAEIAPMGEAFSYVGALAHQMGWSIEETSAVLGQFAQNGFQGERAGTALRGAITELISPTQKTVDIFAKYGLTMEDVNPATHDFADILDIMNERGVTTADTMAIFGDRAGPAMLAALQSGSDAIRTETGLLYECDGAAKQMADTMMSGSKGGLEDFKGSIETLAISMGTLINEYLDPILGILAKVADAFNALPGPVKMIILLLAGLAAAVGPVLLVAGTLISSIGTISTALGVTGLSGILTTVVGILTGPVAIAIAAFAAAAYIVYQNWDTVGPLLERVGNQVQDVFTGIMDFVDPVIVKIEEFVNGALTSLSDWWDVNGDAIMQAASTLGDGLIDIFETMGGVVLFFVSGPMIALYEAFRVALDIIIPLLQYLGRQFGETIMLIVNLINGDFSAAWENIKNIVQNNIDFIVQLVTDVLPTAFSDVWDDILSLASIALDLLIQLITGKTGEAATELKEGIVNAGAEMVDGMLGWVPGVSGVVDGMRDELLRVPDEANTAMSQFGPVVTGHIDATVIQAAAAAGTLVTRTVDEIEYLPGAAGVAMNPFSPAVVNPIKATVSPASTAASSVGTGATNALSSSMKSMGSNTTTVMNGVAASIRNSGSSLASAATSAGAAAVSALNIQLANVQYTAAQIKAAAASGQLFASSAGSSSSGSMPSSGHGGSSSSTGSTGIKRQGSDGTGEDKVKIREAHATGGIAGYTGWHWMERGELAIPQQTNWDQLLVKPIVKALSGGSSGPVSAGNVIIQNMPVTLTSGYNFEQLMSDIEKYNSQKRFQRGISL
jgi:TP901 family phage tail tape measure protein